MAAPKVGAGLAMTGCAPNKGLAAAARGGAPNVKPVPKASLVSNKHVFVTL